MNDQKLRMIEPSIEVFFHYPEGHGTPEQFLESAGRTCYKSEDHITDDSADKFIGMLSKRGHHAMLEHAVASARIVCDRGVTHELVRHRLASYAQESTRYCDYSKDKFDNSIAVIRPLGLTEEQLAIWVKAMHAANRAYQELREAGAPAQVARHVLPISVKTEIVITANLREWMHIFKLRCAKTAHPHIRTLMLQALKVFAGKVPAMFEHLHLEMDEQLQKAE